MHEDNDTLGRIEDMLGELATIAHDASPEVRLVALDAVEALLALVDAVNWAALSPAQRRALVDD